jgi:hypothetical protein
MNVVIGVSSGRLNGDPRRWPEWATHRHPSGSTDIVAIDVKVYGVLLAVGGAILALLAVLLLGGYARAVVFVVGGGMIVYGILLTTAPPPR